MNIASFKDILKKEIKKNGYTQEEFALKLNIGGSTLRTYLSEKSNTIPDLGLLAQMCDLLHCDVDYLLGRISFTTHSAQQVHDSIGLTETSFNYLKGLKDKNEPDDDLKLSTLNQILAAEEFNKLLLYLTYARQATTGFPIKYNPSNIISPKQQEECLNAVRNHEDYIDSREYHASKELGKLFDKIIEIPMEDYLMLYDYIDYYYDMFGERFPLEEFSSNEEAAIQIKQCLLTNTPISKEKG